MTCPECGAEMIRKAELDTPSGFIKHPSLYQCPKCKNVEVE